MQPEIDRQKLITGGLTISLSWLLSKAVPAKYEVFLYVVDAVVLIAESVRKNGY